MQNSISKILLLILLCFTQTTWAQIPTMTLPKGAKINKNIKKVPLNTSKLILSPKRTGFNVSRDGFHFANRFQNNVISETDLRTSGLCGGMVYTALDYFFNSKTCPNQDYMPADHTPLRKHIYSRQVHSIVDNLDKWAEVGFNPGGARNSEFFNWGLQMNSGGRLQELKESIDRNKPVPLGLYEVGGGSAGNHQVMAIGYDLGRYKGDLGAHKEELKIFIYDPNYPKKIRTLRPNVSRQYYYYEEDTDMKWRTYFVDKKYRPKSPPAYTPTSYPKDGKVHELIVKFHTGGDDLRGGNDNLNVAINFFNGTQQVVNNVNQGYRWIDDFYQFISIPLNHPVRASEIQNIVLTTTFRGGVSGDNWNMDGLVIRAKGGGSLDQRIYEKHGSPLFRFTGSRRTFTAIINSTVPPPSSDHMRELQLRVYTGGDDLRGGSDNLNILVQFKDGSKQVFNNVNKGTRWGNNTVKTVTLTLNREVHKNHIQKIVLGTTFSGGIGGDNWNMKWLEIRTKVNGGIVYLYSQEGNPLCRFTGDKKYFTVTPLVL